MVARLHCFAQICRTLTWQTRRLDSVIYLLQITSDKISGTADSSTLTTLIAKGCSQRAGHIIDQLQSSYCPSDHVFGGHPRGPQTTISAATEPNAESLSWPGTPSCERSDKAQDAPSSGAPQSPGSSANPGPRNRFDSEIPATQATDDIRGVFDTVSEFPQTRRFPGQGVSQQLPSCKQRREQRVAARQFQDHLKPKHPD